MSKLSRLLTALSALLLAAMFVFPIWKIDLVAPQYPEGLGMRIHIDRIVGAQPTDLDNINGLNHYIGMARIDPASIPELRYMPWVVGALVALGMLAAAAGRRGLLYGWVGAFSLTALAGLADFWKWGYEYGHNLDPLAPIKVPGMTYQPPLIGSKQLLNILSSSWPDVGGWAAVAALALAAAAVVVRSRGHAASGEHEAPVGLAAPLPRRLVTV
jgi:copper chaperone NosL